MRPEGRHAGTLSASRRGGSFRACCADLLLHDVRADTGADPAHLQYAEAAEGGEDGAAALLLFPNVYDGAIGEYHGIQSYWGVEDAGVVTAKIDEQKTDATRAKILDVVAALAK